MKYVNCLRSYFLLILSAFYINLSVVAQEPDVSSFNIELVRDNFATISNNQHPGNRVGYRFHEHTPIAYGNIPLSDEIVDINKNGIIASIDSIKLNPDLFSYKHEIQKSDEWSRQDWTYYMLPVEDGIEILLII